MREAAFLKQNAEKWQAFEKMLFQSENVNPDELADQFIQLTDDLSYAQTYYPASKTTAYLNELALKVHQRIYVNKTESSSRFITFWTEELPLIVHKHRLKFLYSFIIFGIAILIGAVSAANDSSFVNIILGDDYVHMTKENIKKGDPMAVYKQTKELPMAIAITFNNVRVSFTAFVMGIFASFGTGLILVYNGIMLGSFQYFFYEHGELTQSLLTIWIHGTLEISAIVLAGGAGLILGNSILFPKTFSRLKSFRSAIKDGLKVIIGLVPIFIFAGLLEGFVTRHTGMPVFLSLFIIFGSLAFIIWYFIIYPAQVNRKMKSKFSTTIADINFKNEIE